MKKWTKILILMILLTAVAVGLFLYKREEDRQDGWAHGYTAGYGIGYTDYLNGLSQNSLKLAGEIVPYEAGSGKWKYFILGFDSGYADGLSGEKIWDTNAP